MKTNHHKQANKRKGKSKTKNLMSTKSNKKIKSISPTKVSGEKSASKSFSISNAQVCSKSPGKNSIKVFARWGSLYIDMNKMAFEVEYNLPPLPYKLFLQTSGFFSWASKTLDTEARVDFFLVDGIWKAICFNQTTEGQLDVEIDFESKSNKELLTAPILDAKKRFHCTMHSHNDIGASQSGTDVNDEIGKRGWHITLGDYGSSKVSNHSRLTIQEPAQVDPKTGEKTREAFNGFVEVDIDLLVSKGEVPQDYSYLQTLMDEQCYGLIADFPEEWKDRIEKIPTSYSGRTWGHDTSLGMNKNMTHHYGHDGYSEIHSNQEEFDMMNATSNVEDLDHLDLVLDREVKENRLPINSLDIKNYLNAYYENHYLKSDVDFKQQAADLMTNLVNKFATDKNYSYRLLEWIQLFEGHFLGCSLSVGSLGECIDKYDFCLIDQGKIIFDCSYDDILHLVVDCYLESTCNS